MASRGARQAVDDRAGHGRLPSCPVREWAEVLERRVLLAADLSAKLGPALAAVHASYAKYVAAGPAVGKPFAVSAATVPNAAALRVKGTTIQVRAVAKGKSAAALAKQVTAAGGTLTGQFGPVVTADVPMAALPKLAAAADLKLAGPSYAPFTRAGLVDDQAVQALRAGLGASRFDVTGAGVTVGILSDSFDTGPGSYAADVASGDLPAGVRVLKDYSAAGSDEGRAMAQLVHDVAPGAGLAFYTAFESDADFAAGIVALAKPVSEGGAGAKVIVDDVGYPDEPFYQDGIIAQAIDIAINQYGASYFSAAGNGARAAYESAFRATTATVPGGAGNGTYHDFDPAAGTTNVYQPITLPAGATLQISFQWDQPYASAGGAASGSDVNLYLLNAGKTAVVAAGVTNNVGGDPVELLGYKNPSATAAATVYLAAKLRTGAVPGAMKYIMLGDGSIAGFATNTGASYGHSMAAGGAGVGAAYYQQTPTFRSATPVLESFSSAGGTPILFNAAGVRLGSPDLRQQPRFTSVDGTDTTFFGQDAEGNGLLNFFGTSAAAPHAAAVAALLKQAVPTLTATQIYAALQSTAVDMSTAGYDFDSGHGLIRADAALAAVAGASIAGKVYRDDDADGTRDAGEPGLAGRTVFLDADDDGTLDFGSASFSNPTPVAIPDGGSTTGGSPSRVTSDVVVGGLAGRVTNVTVVLTATHTFDNDLEFTLVSPRGVRVPLVAQVQTGGDNFTNTGFSDAAAALIQSSTAAPFTGTFRPRTTLSTLADEDPNGTWKLEARDYFSPDPGTLQSWGMTIAYAEQTTSTDADGDYAFAGLAPSSTYGTYRVRQVVPAALAQATPTTPYNLTLAAAAVAAGRDFGNVVPPAVVQSVAINGGGNQRSRVSGAVVTFDRAVTLDAGAFAVAGRGGAGAGATVSSFANPSGDGRTWTLTFAVTGQSVVGGGLTDGVYDLTIVAARVHVAPSTGPGLAADYATAFHRLAGDATGDARVDVADLGVLSTAYGSSAGGPNWLPDADFTGDGAVDVADLGILSTAYGKQV